MVMVVAMSMLVRGVIAMFAVFVRDVSEYAVALHGQASATKEQQAGALALVRRPTTDAAATAALHEEITSYAS